jgi:hypothetical protein
MYVDTSSSTQGGKTYRRHLLRESFRENGKVLHRTIANLSHCSDEEISALKLAFKHKGDLSQIGSIYDITTKQGTRFGAIFCLNVIAERLGLTKVLGSHRQGKLALWQVFARLIDQGSRLSAVRLADSHAACDILGLEAFNEDHLYQNLAWLSEHQGDIEQRLFRRRYGTQPPQLFLYDVTSSYLEGVKNILAAFGYNRDGKKGKQQLVIGLLTAPDGVPVAVRVFSGNTQDPKTVTEQIHTLVNGFGVKKVTLVGDRGMLKLPQIQALQDQDFHYITAITKSQIRQLLKNGALQMSLFDNDLCEVEYDKIRYILRRNPLRATEMAHNRQNKLRALQNRMADKQDYLEKHARANPEVAQTNIINYAKKLQLDKWTSITLIDRTLSLNIDQDTLQQETLLDGCYVIKTDLPVEAANTEVIHQRYKDLALVEKAFRTFKRGHLEIQPTFVQTEASTRGHVFVVMLAYLIERELDQYWQHLDVTVSEGIDELTSLRGVEFSIGNTTCQKLPQPSGLCKKLVSSADIKLPDIFPVKKVNVATRKKLIRN